MRCCQLVMGPAGVGKSTYCQAIQNHCAASGRSVHVINLDPAAENFSYRVSSDLRDLISLDDAMEELGYGPNGGLVYCMEYLMENLEWLRDELEKYGDDDYIIFDCPGQVELYSHIPVMKNIVESLSMWGYNVCGIFLIDSMFLSDTHKFVAGALVALSAMVQLELPHINVLTKCDMVDEATIDRYLSCGSAALLGRAAIDIGGNDAAAADAAVAARSASDPRMQRLTDSICSVLDDFTLVSFVPLNVTDEDSIDLVLMHADRAIQYGEDLEPTEPKDEDEDDGD